MVNGRFPDRHFPGQTFPGTTFPGQDVLSSKKDVSRIFRDVAVYELTHLTLFLLFLFNGPIAHPVISWADIHQIFRISMTLMYARVSLSVRSFFDRSRDVAMATDFVARRLNGDDLSTLFRK